MQDDKIAGITPVSQGQKAFSPAPAANISSVIPSQAENSRLDRAELSPLTQQLLQKGDRYAMREFGKDVVAQLPDGEKAGKLDKAKQVFSNLDRLNFSTTDDWWDSFRPGKLGQRVQEHLGKDPAEALVDGKIGSCGEWAFGLYDALEGAGVGSNIVAASDPKLGPFNNHAAVVVKAENGEKFIFDPWAHGKENNGSLAGVKDSRFNGMPEADWLALQASEGKTSVQLIQ